MVFDQAHFGLYKLAGFAICFLLIAVWQWIVPYRKMSVGSNWKQNLSLAGVNALIMGLLCSGCVCLWSIFLRTRGIGLFNMLGLPEAYNIAGSIFLLDFSAFAWHWMNHRLPWLWRFHSVHHSDPRFEASTALRFHAGELLISLGVRFLVVGLFGLSVTAILTFELVYQFFNIFEHGNIRLPAHLENGLSKVFVTPAVHRKHHSLREKELNSNFGTVFSFWDRLARTFKTASSTEAIAVGLQGVPPQSLLQLLTLPFR